jgi:predicted regulator of Ras-like GTPase activity (Roadblock/LC7/MglB family)
MSLGSHSIEEPGEEATLPPERVSRVVQARLGRILAELTADCSDIIGAMVSSTDGRAWAEHLQQGLDRHRFAAMSSALLALGDNVVNEIHSGSVKNILIQSDTGNVYVLHAGSDLLLTVFATATTNIGMSLAHARNAAEEIAALNLRA